jgi:chemotaxis protein CheD
MLSHKVLERFIMSPDKNAIFDENLHVLKPGEYFAAANDNILGTVTGSSVVVCLHDKEKGVGGMCHFIVPGTIGTNGIVMDEIARFGISNMEYLLGEIVKLGGDRKRLVAKVYGSGQVDSSDKRMSAIAKGNIQFIDQYFKMENIAIKDEDLGGAIRKKIIFQPKTGTVRKEEISDEDAALFIRLEKEYIESVFKDKDKTGNVVIF